MRKRLRIINWNFCFHGYNKAKLDFLFSMVNGDTCIMLEEIVPEVYEYIKSAYADNFNFVYSLDYRKPGFFDSDARRLGVLIACTTGIKIVRSGIVERGLFPDRTAYATVDFYGTELKLLALHSITGCGYYKAKSIQYESFAEFVAEYTPDVVGMDANEPRVDSHDIDQMQFFDNGHGAACFFRSLKNAKLSDAFVSANGITKTEEGKCLATSYRVRGRGEVRYDFLFVKNKIEIIGCEYLYGESVDAGSDHALVYADAEVIG